jgi:hypothetical protein
MAAFILALPAATASASGLVTYPAKLSVVGGLTITTNHDFTGSCEPGQAWTIEADADVNLAGRVEVEVIGSNLVQSSAAKTAGGAVNKNTLSGYRETNYCPPEEPVPLDPAPVCERHTGAGVANLSKGSRGVVIGIGRKGGGDQDQSCVGNPVIRPTPADSQIEALESSYDAIVLPLEQKAAQFKKLRVGKSLSTRVKVSGPCNRTNASVFVFREDTCTVSGSFQIKVKRLPGKGRGVTRARNR